MFCTKCGTPLNENGKFCTGCGTPNPNYRAPQQTVQKQPVYQQPKAPKPPKPAKQKAPMKAPSKAKVTVSVLLCVLCALLTLATCTVGVLRSALSEENLNRFEDNFDYEKLTVPGTGQTIGEFVCANVDPETLRAEDFTPKNVDKLIKKTDMIPFALGIVKRYTSYLVSDEKLKPVDTDEIMDFIEDNRDEFESRLGCEIREEDLEYIREQLDDEITPMLNKSGLKRELGLPLDTLRTVLSKPVYITMIVICAVLFLAVLLLNIPCIAACLRRIAPVWIVVGAILLLLFIGSLAAGILLPALSPALRPATLGFLLRAVIFLAVPICILALTKKHGKKGVISVE